MLIAQEEYSVSDKEWVCPCTGCQKARKKAFREVEQILEKYQGDMLFAWHEVSMLVKKELNPPKKK